MRKVFRSLVWETSAEKSDITLNYKSVSPDLLLNLTTSERGTLDFLLDFFQRKGEPPQLQAVLDHFETANNAEGIVIYEEMAIEKPYLGATFQDLFASEVESQAAAKFAQTCKLGMKIATQGAELTKGVVIKGVDEAVSYMASNLQPVPKLGQGKVPANIKLAGLELTALYENRKNNPQQSYGILTGYGIFDAAWNGIKKKQLTLIGGYGGHLKSTLIMNIALNGAVDGGWNMYICTSEMPADDMKLMIIAMHSANPKFQPQGRPIHTTRLLLGALNPAEEKFFELVKDDLINNPLHGSIRIKDASDFTSSGSIFQMVQRDHMDEEVDCVIPDYITRLPLDAKYLRYDHTVGMNLTIADWKRFCMQFDNGEGIPALSPFQINREGYKRAKTSGGRYNKSDFAQYNAAEKEADNMGYIFFDEDEAATSEPKVGLAKARYGAMVFDPVSTYIDPDSRRIFDLSTGLHATAGAAPSGGGSGDSVEL